MGTLRFKNNASTTLSGLINDSQTTITVVNASGFPVLAGSDYFYATMYEVSGGTEINIEIVKVTATNGAIWTVVRAQDGTTARARDGVTTCYVEQRMTAAGAQLMVQIDNNLSDLQSASTARTNLGLGSMATQNSSNVTITGGSVSGVSITSLDSGTTIQDNLDNTKQLRFEVAGISTATTRTLTAPNADGTIALTSDLTAYQPLDSELTAIAGLGANGLIARTGATTAAVRSIGVPAAGLSITNADGVSGNPTLALANDLAAVEAISTTGFVKRTATETWTAAAIADGDVPSALTGKTYNALSLTANASGFSVAGGTSSKTLTVNNSITLAGTDGTTITLPSSTGTVALNNQSFFIGTTSVAINRASASLSLTGVSIDGSAGSAGSATSATTATNLASGVLGSVPYQSAAGTTALLSPNTTTTKSFLRMTGTGAAGAAPAWDTIANADVPSALTGKTYNGLTLTAAATGFTVAGGTTSKTLTVSNTLTFSGTDGSTLNIGAGGTLATGAFATIANYATLASPTFTGTPAAPTAAVDTNTTQIATTAYVVGQGYAKLASPTFTGTPAAPTAAVDTNTTQVATTAYVVGQGYLKSATAASTYLALTGGTLTGNLTFSGTSRRIIGDFNNATQTSRTLFQGSVTNGNTQVGAIPNGSSTQAAYVIHNASDPTNASTAALSINSTEATISSAINGSGTYLPLIAQTGGANRATFGALGGLDLATGLREFKVAVAASDIDVRSGNYFTKTISGATTLTVSNVPAAGTAASFILDLTNGGSATITWFSGVKWAGGTAPTLTSAGRDVLGFFTHDGGTTWTGLLLGKDVK